MTTAAAVPSVEGYGQIIGKDGKAVGGNGPPVLAGNWIDDADLNPYRLVAGRAPQATDEVVVKRGGAKKAGGRKKAKPKAKAPAADDGNAVTDFLKSREGRATVNNVVRGAMGVLKGFMK